MRDGDFITSGDGDGDDTPDCIIGLGVLPKGPLVSAMSRIFGRLRSWGQLNVDADIQPGSGDVSSSRVLA